MLRFIDLFAGIGGFRYALEQRGLTCVFSSEIDDKAREVYHRNFGDLPHGDITAISEREIPAHDVLCAGFPCQSFSISGKSKGLDDDRGRLFYEIVRIAQYHQPGILLLENVKNILTVNDGRVLQTIETKLDEIGYTLYTNVLNASHFGIPQSRERVYFVGLKKQFGSGSRLSYQPPKETFRPIYLEDILEAEVNESLYVDRSDMVLDTADQQHALAPIRVGHVNKGGQGERIYSDKGHAITLSAFGGGVGARTGLYLIGDRVRRLSINECKSLMGFPKSFHVAEGMQGYQQLGNAVITPMIGLVYDSIRSGS